MRATTIKFFGFVFAFVLFASSLQASAPVKVDDNPLKTQITKLVQNPDLISHGIESAAAKVKFTVSVNQEISVVSVDTNNEYIENFVKQRLNNKHINVQGLRNDVVYTINLNFQVAY